MSAFELLANKVIGGEVVRMEWCPTMDLLALVTADSQLMVHRPNGWQRLIVITGFDHPITCVAWQPDGSGAAAMALPRRLLGRDGGGGRVAARGRCGGPPGPAVAGGQGRKDGARVGVGRLCGGPGGRRGLRGPKRVRPEPGQEGAERHQRGGSGGDGAAIA